MLNQAFPTEFMNLIGLHSMMLLLTRIRKTKDLKNSEFAEILVFEAMIMVPFNLIFISNSISKWRKFFSSPLIKWLWKKVFFAEKPLLI
jgi:hypothetical protein